MHYQMHAPLVCQSFQTQSSKMTEHLWDFNITNNILTGALCDVEGVQREQILNPPLSDDVIANRHNVSLAPH